MVQAGQIIALPATLYVQTTNYQFRINSTFDVQLRRPDGQGYYDKTYNFEKNYSLTPQQSLTFTNRIKVVKIEDKKIAYVEACIKNHMDVPIKFERLECSGNKKVTFIKILGQNWRELEVPKDTSIKLVAQYEVDQDYVKISLFVTFGLTFWVD